MPEEKAFEKLVRQAVQDECRNMNGIYDVVIEFKNLKSGIQESLILYDKDGKLKNYKEVSNTSMLLMMQREYLLPFYIYVNSDAGQNYEAFRKKIGSNIGKGITEQIRNLLEQWN